jgi:hypothetical protein
MRHRPSFRHETHSRKSQIFSYAKRQIASRHSHRRRTHEGQPLSFLIFEY